MRLLARIAAGLGLLGAALFVGDTVRYLHLGEQVAPHSPGACRALAGLRGAEDLVATHGGSVIASLDDRTEPAAGAPSGRLVAIAGDGRSSRLLWDGGGQPFHPHGIDLLRTDDGQETLFVIDHAEPADRVLVFRFADDALTLLREIPAATRALNDIAALAPDRFYATVDHTWRRPAAVKASDFLRIPNGAVDYFDGTRWQRVIGGLVFANGIALAPDRQRLYVAEMLEGRVRVYARHDGAWQRADDIVVPGSPDNLSWAPDGALLVAAHPKILDLSHERRARAFRAPSRIVRIGAPGALAPALSTLFADPGARLASASVALQSAAQLFVGSVFDDHALVCDLPAR